MAEGINKNILQMEKITKNFSGVTVLDHVNFAVRKGEVHALVGKNGAGKSTLIKVLAGIYSKDSGTIIFEGKKVNIFNSYESQKLGINFVHQDLRFVPFFNVFESVFLGQEIIHHNLIPFVNKTVMYNKTKKALEQLKVNLNLNTKMSNLTIAERQMVMIARVLIQKSKLIIFDEPTASLSSWEIERLFTAIGHLKQIGTSVIYISHRLKEIFQIADRVTVLRDGKKIDTRDTKKISDNELIKMIIGKELPKETNDLKFKRRKINKEVFKVKNLEVGSVVKSVTFSVLEGEILGIVGLVGSGKTEIAEAIIGTRKKKGEIYVGNEKVQINSPREAIQRNIYLIPEDRRGQGLMLGMPVKDNISVSILGKLCKFQIINLNREIEIAKHAVHKLSIEPPNIHQIVAHLSGGNQQKVVVSKGLQCNPNLFIFDEITAGVDVEGKNALYDIVRKLAKNRVSCIYISNDVSEIMKVSDRILVMYRGEIVKEFLREETTEKEVLFYVLTGKSK